MAELTIPKDHRPVLNQIRRFPEDSIQALVSALKRSPDEVPSIPGVSADEAEIIHEVVTELYRVREFFDMGVPEFASGIAAALQEVESFPIGEVAAFEERLTKILTLEAVAIETKAAVLSAEYERRFCGARILTDARPVYTDDPAKLPSAGMIMHTLRISYHDNTPQLREFYVAMNANDVRTMRALLDRADVKAKSLESVFGAAKVKIVTP